MKRLWRWFDHRTGASGIIGPFARHPVPPGTADRITGWLYMFGSAALFVFLLQVVTGVALATKYIPSTAHAYESLQFITYDTAFGRFVRGLHFYGASAMIVLVTVHMLRVFLTASYKFPREINWLTGVVLLGLTLGMAFTGQLLRWDENGVWSVVVATQFAGRVPLIGNHLAQFLLAGETLGGATLSRFYVFHVFVMPGLIFAFIAAHMYLVLYHGISETPRRGQLVDPKTYTEWYKEHLKTEGCPYWPDAAWREVVFGMSVIAVIALLAYFWGPRELGAPPDPTQLHADPRPDWFFLWYYALLAVKPRGLENLVMVYAPLLALILLTILPFVANKGERNPWRRPWAVGAAAIVLIGFGVLLRLGVQAPWVPDFDTEPLPPHVIGATSGPIYEGAQLFHQHGCQYCHAIDGMGGQYGPDLTDLGRRLPAHEATIRIFDGIGDMPGYRNQLTADEMHAILAFLYSLPDR